MAGVTGLARDDVIAHLQLVAVMAIGTGSQHGIVIDLRRLPCSDIVTISAAVAAGDMPGDRFTFAAGMARAAHTACGMFELGRLPRRGGMTITARGIRLNVIL